MNHLHENIYLCCPFLIKRYILEEPTKGKKDTRDIGAKVEK